MKCRAIKYFTVFLAYTLLFAGCVKIAPSETRVSVQELAALREQYPYNDNSGMVDMIGINSFEKLKTKNIQAVVVFTTNGELTTETKYLPPFEENVSWATNNYELAFLPIHVEKILWAEEGFSNSEDLVLAFGSIEYAASLQIEECFSDGQRYVGYVTNVGENHIYAGTENLYVISKFGAYYLTENDVLMSICSWPGIDSCSGMYLSAFENEVAVLLNSPEAELTPVESELETE